MTSRPARSATVDTLVACRAKIRRAQAELERLSMEVERFSAEFREGEAYAVTRDIDPQTGEEVHRFHVLNPLPLTSWGVTAGVIVHLCRSSLDNLIELLTEKHSGACLLDSEFPIFGSAADFRRPSRRGGPARSSGFYKIRGISPAAATLVEQRQPYNATDRLADSILWVLHKLSNIDKHRAPAVVGLVGWVMGLTFRSGLTRTATTPLGPVPFDEGTEFARFDPPPTGEPNMDVGAKFSLDIAFDGGPAAQLDVIPTLRQIVAEVDAVLTEFAPFLA